MTRFVYKISMNLTMIHTTNQDYSNVMSNVTSDMKCVLFPISYNDKICLSNFHELNK